MKHHPYRSRPACFIDYRWAWGRPTPRWLDQWNPASRLGRRIAIALGRLTRHTCCFYDEGHTCR